MVTRQLEHGEAVGGNDSRPCIAHRDEAIEDARVLLLGLSKWTRPL